MDEILESLGKAVLEYDNAGAEHWARKAIEVRISSIQAMDALTGAIRQVGEGYGRGELWLPDLVGAASAMQKAMPIIEEQLRKEGKSRKSLGLVVVGTVFGDIHNIGKDMVSALFVAGDFEVIDLGVNVKAEQFVVAVKEYSPKILAMSALMTMTAPEQEKVIKALIEEDLRDGVKVIVGGGAITQEFAEEIGADGFEPTAPRAIDLARRLVK